MDYRQRELAPTTTACIFSLVIWVHPSLLPLVVNWYTFIRWLAPLSIKLICRSTQLTLKKRHAHRGQPMCVPHKQVTISSAAPDYVTVYRPSIESFVKKPSTLYADEFVVGLSFFYASRLAAPSHRAEIAQSSFTDRIFMCHFPIDQFLPVEETTFGKIISLLGLFYGSRPYFHNIYIPMLNNSGSKNQDQYQRLFVYGEFNTFNFFTPM